MNLLWLRRRNEEEISRRKQSEVQERVNKWSMDRSREESEYLRKRESMKLVAGLERVHRQEYGDNHTAAKHPETVGETNAKNISDTPGVTTGGRRAGKTSPTDEKPRSDSNSLLLVVKSTKKQDVKKGGGMHFRNQLPSNYTPPSRRSNQPPLSSASWKERSSSTPSPSTPSSGKQTLEMANPQSELHSDSSSESSGFSDDEESEEYASVTNEAALSPRNQPSHRAMKLQPYHAPFYTNSRSEDNAIGARGGGADAISKSKVSAIFTSRADLSILSSLLRYAADVSSRHCSSSNPTSRPRISPFV